MALGRQNDNIARFTKKLSDGKSLLWTRVIILIFGIFTAFAQKVQYLGHFM